MIDTLLFMLDLVVVLFIFALVCTIVIVTLGGLNEEKNGRK
jgi:hypothetical protein